jgi:hypothetical protein
MPQEGYIALWRKTLDSRIFQNEGLLKVWVWCLLKASHKKRWAVLKTGRGVIEIEILPGHFVFGRHSAAKELKMVPSTVWKRIVKLKNLSNLGIESNKQYSIINIINWDIYQVGNKKSNSKSNMQVTCKEHASDTDNNVDNVNKKDIYGEFVKLTKNEYGKLTDKYSNIVIKSEIEDLNNYIGSTGKKYKSHYHTILSWLRKDGVPIERKQPSLQEVVS